MSVIHQTLMIVIVGADVCIALMFPLAARRAAVYQRIASVPSWPDAKRCLIALDMLCLIVLGERFTLGWHQLVAAF